MERQPTISVRRTDDRATDRFVCLPDIFGLVTPPVFFTMMKRNWIMCWDQDRQLASSGMTKTDKAKCKDNQQYQFAVPMTGLQTDLPAYLTSSD